MSYANRPEWFLGMVRALIERGDAERAATWARMLVRRLYCVKCKRNRVDVDAPYLRNDLCDECLRNPKPVYGRPGYVAPADGF